MANPDALNQQRASTRLLQPTVKSHLAYTLLCALVMMVMLSLLRLGLLVYNSDMMLDTPASTFLEAFVNGLRLDLRLVVYLSIPLILALFSVRAMAARGFFRLWLTVVSSIALFLGLMEMDFYR
ncbi:MAG: LTA synthase family protein, partial [Pseudomonas sp.]